MVVERAAQRNTSHSAQEDYLNRFNKNFAAEQREELAGLAEDADLPIDQLLAQLPGYTPAGVLCTSTWTHVEMGMMLSILYTCSICNAVVCLKFHTFHTAPALGLVAHAGARPRRPRAPPAEQPAEAADKAAEPAAADAKASQPTAEAAAAVKQEDREAGPQDEQGRALQQAASDARAAQPTGDTLGTADVQITVRWFCNDTVGVCASCYCHCFWCG